MFKNWDLHMKKQDPFFSSFSRKKKKRKSPDGQRGACIAPGRGLAGAGPSAPGVPSSAVPIAPRGLPSTEAERRRSRLVTRVLDVPHAPPARPRGASELAGPPPHKAPSRLLTTVVWGRWRSCSTDFAESALAGEGLSRALEDLEGAPPFLSSGAPVSALLPPAPVY